MQQHQMNDYHQPSAMMTKFAKNGVALSQEERAALARRKGLCVGCGIKTHTVSVFKKSPITNDYVYKGICISCHPDRVPRDIFSAYQKHNPRIHAPLTLQSGATGGGSSDAEMMQRRRRQQVLEARRRDLEQQQQVQQLQQDLESPRPRKAPFPDRRIQSPQAREQKMAATIRLNEEGGGHGAAGAHQEHYSSPVSNKEIIVAPPLSPRASPSSSSGDAQQQQQQQRGGPVVRPELEHSDFGAIQAYLVQERRPVTIQVQESSLTTANGVYEFDPTMTGKGGNAAKQYPAYSKHGYLEEAHEAGSTPVTFLIHRSAQRWFLSAVLKNGGRVYLYCAPVTPSKQQFPPAKGWAKMNGVAGTASLSIIILTTEEVPAGTPNNTATGAKKKRHSATNNREISLAGIPELPFSGNSGNPSNHSVDPPARYSRANNRDAPRRKSKTNSGNNTNVNVSANSDHSDATEITSNNHHHQHHEHQQDQQQHDTTNASEYYYSQRYQTAGAGAGTGGVSESMMREDDVSSLTTHSTIPGGGGNAVVIGAHTAGDNTSHHEHSVATQRVSNNNIIAAGGRSRPHQQRLPEVSELTFGTSVFSDDVHSNASNNHAAAAAAATATTTLRGGGSLSPSEQDDLQLLCREMDASAPATASIPAYAREMMADVSSGAASAPGDTMIDDPYGHQRRCSGLQNERRVMEDLNLSSLEETPPKKSSKDLEWNPEDSAQVSLEDYDALPEANTNDLFFPWEKPKTAAGSGSSLVAGRVTIQITTPTMQEFYVIMNAQPTTTIRELKAEIQKRQGIPTSQQELTQGRNKWPTLLADDNTLESYGLFNTSDNASAPNVDMHFPPGYPCRRLLIECLGETHNVDVDPCDTIERVILSIRTKSTWFLDQLRYMPKSEAEKIGIELSLEGQALRDTAVTLAELSIPNQTIMQMEVITAIDADKIACAAAYQEETLQEIIKESVHSMDEKSFSIDQLDKATAKQLAYDREKAYFAEKAAQRKQSATDLESSTSSSAAAQKESPSAEPTKEDLLARLAECSAHQEKVMETVKRESNHSCAVEASVKMESTRSAGEDSFAIDELVLDKKPAAKKEENNTKLEPPEESKDDLLAKLARCRAYQQEVMEKINSSSADISHTFSADSKESQSNGSLSSETGGVAAAGKKEDDKPAPQSRHAAQVTLTETAGTASSSSSFDPSKLVEEVEEMKQKVERMERETQQGLRPAAGSVQILPAKVGDVSIGMPVVVMAPPAPPIRNTSIGVGSQPPPSRTMPHYQRSQHSQRISKLEEKVAAYEDQISALLKVMELTHAGGGGTDDDQLMKRRVELAHKILRGEQDSVLERAVYGFQMDEGDFQPNGQ